MTLKPNFDYYDTDQFRKVKNLWNKKKSLGIFHTNICSLQKNVDSLEDLLHDLDYSFDVIALTETWYKKETEGLYDFPGYSPEHIYQTNKASGTGATLFLKKGIEYKPRPDLTKCEEYLECLFVEITGNVFNSPSNILVGVVYRPPNSDLNLFSTLMDSVLHVEHPVRCGTPRSHNPTAPRIV